jgi:hypothetical protein
MACKGNANLLLLIVAFGMMDVLTTITIIVFGGKEFNFLFSWIDREPLKMIILMVITKAVAYSLIWKISCYSQRFAMRGRIQSKTLILLCGCLCGMIPIITNSWEIVNHVL